MAHDSWATKTNVVNSETEMAKNDRAFCIEYFSCLPFDSTWNIL